MQFLRALVTRATSAKSSTFTAQLAAGEHKFGEAYPAGTWGTKAGGTKDKDSGKGDWEYKDGKWVNSKTGETWSGEKEKDPGTKKDYGNKEDWAKWDKKDDGAKVLAASFMAVVAASMNMF